jgi:hypothetical protein
MSKRSGDPPNTEVEPVAKKRRQNKPKITGLSETDIANTDLKNVRRNLLAIIKNLANQVDADWHDGYEDQELVINDFKVALIPVLQSTSGSLQCFYPGKQGISEMS